MLGFVVEYRLLLHSEVVGFFLMSRDVLILQYQTDGKLLKTQILLFDFLQYCRYLECNSARPDIGSIYTYKFSTLPLNAKGIRMHSGTKIQKNYRTSRVWKYFEVAKVDNQGVILDLQKAISKQCHRTFQTKGGNASNLAKHVKDRPPDLFKEFKVSFNSC